MKRLEPMRFFLVGFFVLFSLVSFSQMDTRLWAFSKADVKLNKRLSFSVEHQERFESNPWQRRNNFNEINLAFDKSRWQFTGIFRHHKKTEIDFNEFRVAADINYRFRKKKKDFQIENRIRFQHEWYQNRAGFQSIIRNKLKLSYPIYKQFKIRYGLEIFIPIEKEIEFRNKIDLSHPLGENFRCVLGYAVQNKLGSNSLTHILSFGITLKMKVKKQ
jgi:hypothetical protein